MYFSVFTQSPVLSIRASRCAARNQEQGDKTGLTETFTPQKLLIQTYIIPKNSSTQKTPQLLKTSIKLENKSSIVDCSIISTKQISYTVSFFHKSSFSQDNKSLVNCSDYSSQSPPPKFPNTVMTQQRVLSFIHNTHNSLTCVNTIKSKIFTFSKD